MVDSCHAPLGDRVEGAERLDLVTKQLDANGPVPVGGEQIDNATAAGERARCIDRINQPPSTSTEPVGEFFEVEAAANLDPAGAGLDFAWVGEWCEKCLDAGHHERRSRSIGHGQPFDDGEPFGIGGVAGRAIVFAEAFDRREKQGRQVAEQRHVIDEVVGLSCVWQDDDERAGFGGPGLRHGRHRQRRRRSPGSADRPAVSLAEGGDHVGEPAVCIEGFSQAKQPPGWLAGVMCHACGCTRSPSG